MKKKSETLLLQTCLALWLILASQTCFFGMITIRVGADEIAKVYVQPREYNATSIGETFTMSVNIANVTNLFGYEFKLYYNTTLLDGLLVQLPADHFMKPVNPGSIFIVKQEVLDNFNATHGRVWVSLTLLAPEAPKSGSGTFATINFKATALGGPYPLIFIFPGYPYPVKLSNPQAQSIPCTAEGAMVKVGVAIVPSEALIYMEPPTYTALSLFQTFTMNVTIANVTNLYSYEYKLFYNRLIVQALSADLPSNHFLKPVNSTKILIQKEVRHNYNSTHGQIMVNASLLAPETAKSGNGTLTTISFRAMSRGNTSVHFEGTKLNTPPPVVQLPHTSKDGQIISSPPIIPSEGRMIDLFTQNEPYSGKGINVSSDAFASQSKVILYANVTYRGEPVANKLVAFEVYGPPNPYYNYTIEPRTAMSNASGIAMIDFSLPWPIEHPIEIVFGTWFARAKVEIVGETVVDTLTFKVGWIVEIVSMDTIDENLTLKTHFARGTCVGVKLHMRNIAMLPKTATIIVTAYDTNNDSFDSIVLDDFNVEPGETYIFTHCFLSIPRQAAIGNAMVNASAYTPELEPYCPEVSAKFVITTRNVAVINVIVSAIDVIAGQIVNVTVIVTNKGSETETFSVSAYYGSSLIQTLSVTSLPPGQNRNITFIWNTIYVPAGNYTIKAVAETVPGEIETEDNTYIDDVVTVRVSRIVGLPRELFIVALIVAATLALFAIALLLALRKRETPQPVMLNVDVIPS